jgi:hypothetical protein
MEAKPALAISSSGGRGSDGSSGRAGALGDSGPGGAVGTVDSGSGGVAKMPEGGHVDFCSALECDFTDGGDSRRSVGPPLFAGGDTLTFTAKGDAVPSFTDSLVAPTPLVVTGPSLGRARRFRGRFFSAPS